MRPLIARPAREHEFQESRSSKVLIVAALDAIQICRYGRSRVRNRQSVMRSRDSI